MKAEEDAIYPERDAMESGSLAFRGKEEEEREGMPQNLPETSVRRSWPKQVYFIMGNEVCERFSFYGMRAILVVYMTGSLKMEDSNAESAFHGFTAACYLLPLLGAWLADNLFGKYPVILYLSIVYCFGHAVLALIESKFGLFLGLALISMGTGGIKPCVAALVGDQFDETNSYMLASMFAAFYWCINLGSATSMATIPIVLQISGSSLAFAIPGIFMAIALVIFLAGRNMYIMIGPETGAEKPASFRKVIWHCILHTGDRRPGQGFWYPALERFSQQELDSAKSIVNLLSLFACISAFEALFDQSSSTWVVQGTKMNLDIFGWKMPAAQMQAANPLLVMGLIPIFETFVYPLIAKRLGNPLTSLQKMGAGMILAGLPFLYLAIFQGSIDNGKQPHILWQAPAYLLLTISEILVNITGLQFSYSQAPASLKSTILSLFLLTTFVGNSLDAIVMKINILNEFWTFIGFAIFMFCTAVVFILLALSYDVKEFPRKESTLTVELEMSEENSLKDTDASLLIQRTP